MQNDDLAQAITGNEKPRSFILDASILDYEQEYKIVCEDVKQNSIIFSFPSGVNKLDLLEECRALTQLDDFDMMFDITMQMLVDKDLVISVRDTHGKPVEMAAVHVTDRYMNLRGDNFIDEYPVVVTWLTEFISGMLSKKFPTTPPKQKHAQENDEKKKKVVYKTNSQV